MPNVKGSLHVANTSQLNYNHLLFYAVLSVLYSMCLPIINDFMTVLLVRFIFTGVVMIFLKCLLIDCL